MDHVDEIISTTLANTFCIIIPKQYVDGRCKSMQEYRKKYRDCIDQYIYAFKEKPKYGSNMARNNVIQTIITDCNRHLYGDLTYITFVELITKPLFSSTTFGTLTQSNKIEFFNKYFNSVFSKVSIWCVEKAGEIARLRFYEERTEPIKRNLKIQQESWKMQFKNMLSSERDQIFNTTYRTIDCGQPAKLDSKSNLVNSILTKYKKLVVEYKRAQTEIQNLRTEIRVLREKSRLPTPFVQPQPQPQQLVSVNSDPQPHSEPQIILSNPQPEPNLNPQNQSQQSSNPVDQNEGKDSLEMSSIDEDF
jgi:hypothetical protein